MMPEVSWVRRYASRFAAVAILLTLYGFTRLPELPGRERASLAGEFRFHRVTLPAAAGERWVERPVHPSFHHIAAWVSAIGAAVAVADLDGDGLPNDLCSIDARVDRTLIAPVPGTGARFAPFPIDPQPFDRAHMAPTGCMTGDWNEDGATDLLLYFWGRTPVLFLRRAPAEGPPSAAAFRQVELVPAGGIWNTAVATQADFDGDGHVDLLFGNYFQDGRPVLGADGTGSERMQNSMSRAYNAGYKHLLLGGGGTAGPEPEARFAAAPGIFDEEVARGWTLAIGAADLDGDLRPEIYIANDFGPDRLLHNRSTPGHVRFARLEGRRTFGMPASKVLGFDSFKGMGVDFGDLNGDGLLDLYVSNIANEWGLQESHFAFVSTGETGAMAHGIAPYYDRSEELGLSRSGFSWEAKLGDFNNDGVLETMQATGFITGPEGGPTRWPELQELAMGNDQLLTYPRSWPRFRPGDDISGHLHNPFFVRSASGRYFDLASEVGITEKVPSRGIAPADVDGDGDLDFAVANQWADSSFYTNDSPRTGAFLGLRLLLPVGAEQSEEAAVPALASRVVPGRPGTIHGRPAIGASVAVVLPDGRRLVSEVDGGNGHTGDRSPEVHLGLGRLAAGTAVPVTLHWRDARGKVHRETLNLAPGWHTVLLGAGKES